MTPRLSTTLAVLALVVMALPQQSFAQLSYKAGFTERVRHEYWLNNRDMSNQGAVGTVAGQGDRSFFRFKTSVWGQVDYEEQFSLFAKLTNEIKSYTYYGGRSSKGARGDTDEIFVDNLYLDIKKPGELPVNFRIGRQDLLNQYGENFLIADGTPGDGSRSFYFNAVKASWTVNDTNTLDTIYLNNPRTEQWLPIVNETDPASALEMSDESGVIVDLKNKAIENLLLEPYYIYKHEGGGGGGLQAQTGKIHTVGGFAKYSLDPLTFHVQLADQFGDYGSVDREGLGGYAFVDYSFSDIPLSPVWTVGYVYLSGDDPNTPDNEGWDPLFCRYPIWSEIVPQQYTGESGNSYWSNLSMYRTQLALKLSDKMKLAMIYNYLRANEFVNANAAYAIVGNNKDRGHLLQSKLDYAFNKNVAAFLQGEYFIPGDFYNDDADPAIFVRSQVEVKF